MAMKTKKFLFVDTAVESDVKFDDAARARRFRDAW